MHWGTGDFLVKLNSECRYGMGECAQADLRAAESSSAKPDGRARYLLSQVLKHLVLSCSLWFHISSHVMCLAK